MSPRFRRFVLLLTAFAAVGTGAFGQSETGSPSLDALPKHPIPYRTLTHHAVKPKPKPKPKPAPNAAAPLSPPPGPPAPLKPGPAPFNPAARPAALAKSPSAAPASRPLAPPHVIVAPPVAAPKVATPPVPAPPVSALKVMALPAPPPPKPAPPAVAPPPPLPAPQPGARLQSGQSLPASDLEAFIDGQVARAMASDHIAGVAVAVVQNGQLVMEKGYGVGAGARKLDPRATLVRLGSASQIFTWIAALKAIEDGKLSLDAPVNSYLPEGLKLPDEGFDHPVLFRHLMGHTAGFEDRALGRRYVRDADRLQPLEDALKRLRPRRVRAAGLLSIPSDYGVALAGDIVARTQGRPFDQLIETDILKPLALSHTSFREPYPTGTTLPDPLSQALSKDTSDGFLWTPSGLQPQPYAYGQSLAPAIAASTTADDMARLMIALLNDGKMGEASIYGAKAAALLQTPVQPPAPNMDGWGHGMAMQTLPGGFPALSDVGATPAFHSDLTLVPGLHLGVFVTANTNTGGALTRDLPAAIMQRFYASDVATPTAATPGAVDYAGTYLSAKRAYHGLEAFADRLTRNAVVTAESSGGGLIVSDHGETRTFYPTSSAGLFRSANGAELLTTVTDGKAQAYVLGSEGGGAERTKGLHSRGVLKLWAAITVFTLLTSFAGLFIRGPVDQRETSSQRIANVTQIATCLVWCLSFAAFGLFAQGGLSATSLTFDWPNRWLVTASWLGLVAALLSLLMVTQLPGVWQEERRIHGWSIARKLRHTITIVVFLAFTAVLAAWGALEPWSS